MVQMTCAREHLEPFTFWYNSHLPNLLRIPGYQWAQRYVNLDGGTRFTAFLRHPQRRRFAVAVAVRRPEPASHRRVRILGVQHS